MSSPHEKVISHPRRPFNYICAEMKHGTISKGFTMIGKSFIIIFKYLDQVHPINF